MEPLVLAASCAASFLAAVVSGVVGMAGGSLLLAALLLLNVPPSSAIPLHAAVQLAANGAHATDLRHHVRVEVLPSFLLAALSGPFFGLLLFRELSPAHLKAPVGVLLLLLAVFPEGAAEGAPWPSLPPSASFAPAGFVGGSRGVVVGVVGPLLAPFFLSTGFRKEETVGTKAVCQVALHVLKILAFGFYGFASGAVLLLLAPLLVSAWVGTRLGRRLLERLSEEVFRRPTGERWPFWPLVWQGRECRIC